MHKQFYKKEHGKRMVVFPFGFRSRRVPSTIPMLMAVVLFLAIPLITLASGNDFVKTELRVDLAEVNEARDYTHWVLAADQPNNSGGYTTGWFGVDLDQFDGTLYSAKFAQVGLITDEMGVRWFVYGEAGVECLQGQPAWDGLGCMGAYGDRVALFDWIRVELVTYGQGFWIARVYDAAENPLDVAKIYSSSLKIYRALASMEEAYSVANDPFLLGSFYHWHPRYMEWWVGFQDWPDSSGGNNNFLQAWPSGICPDHYGGQLSQFDPRYWYAGSWALQCNVNPQF